MKSSTTGWGNLVPKIRETDRLDDGGKHWNLFKLFFFIAGSVGHAVMNLEDNISVTENYFLVDSLDDYIQG